MVSEGSPSMPLIGKTKGMDDGGGSPRHVLLNIARHENLTLRA
jgi:hypothetical protein